jgi:hypothetical protein
MKKIEAQVNWEGPINQRQWFVRINHNITGQTTDINVSSERDGILLADVINNDPDRLKLAMSQAETLNAARRDGYI